MKIGKAINALKNKQRVTREIWEHQIELFIVPGICPENSGRVEEYIFGISINLFDISTSTNLKVKMPEIYVNHNIEDVVAQYIFSIEDILAEDWIIVE